MEALLYILCFIVGIFICALISYVRSPRRKLLQLLRKIDEVVEAHIGRLEERISVLRALIKEADSHIKKLASLSKKSSKEAENMIKSIKKLTE